MLFKDKYFKEVELIDTNETVILKLLENIDVNVYRIKTDDGDFHIFYNDETENYLLFDNHDDLEAVIYFDTKEVAKKMAEMLEDGEIKIEGLAVTSGTLKFNFKKSEE